MEYLNGDAYKYVFQGGNTQIATNTKLLSILYTAHVLNFVVYKFSWFSWQTSSHTKINPP